MINQISKSKNFLIVKTFLEKVLDVSSLQAATDAKKLSKILSMNVLNSMLTSIQEADLKRCNGLIRCSNCWFRAFSSEEKHCSFIHQGCASWT